MDLTNEECRVLGALIEKHLTTPDHYPLTTKALTAACNQSSNRDPVVAYDEDTVIDAVNGLRSAELGRTVRRHGERAMKHTEVVSETLSIDRRQKALLAVLLLRGPQTVGELRSRTERYCNFESLDDVSATLELLGQRDEPLVELLGRQPGQKEARYRQLLGGDDVITQAGPSVASHSETAPAQMPAGGDVEVLRAEVASLRAEVRDLRSLVQDRSR